jgi:hypothetical protein
MWIIGSPRGSVLEHRRGALLVLTMQ